MIKTLPRSNQGHSGHQDNQVNQGGFLSILALLIVAITIIFFMYKYFDTDTGSDTDQSPMEINRSAIDDARNIQIQADLRAKETNDAAE